MKIPAMALVLAFVCLAIGSRSQARAEPVLTGAALLNLCEGNLAQQAQCDGYLRGVSNTLEFIGKAVPGSGVMVGCVPVGTSALKLRSVMIKMLHRKEIHKDAAAASLAMTGFSAAWRCNPNGPYHDAEEALGRAIR
jgi:hypothetical protein